MSLIKHGVIVSNITDNRQVDNGIAYSTVYLWNLNVSG